MFRLYCASYPRLAQAWPVPECFSHTAALVQELSDGELPSALESRSLKEQFWKQLGAIAAVPTSAEMEAGSREALAAGCLCGALDGAWLYLQDEPPEPCSLDASFAEELQRVVEVADLYWRGLDAEELEEQCRYGHEENLRTDVENVEALTRLSSAQGVRQLLRETFRTGYGIGMIEAARGCLLHAG